MSECVGFLTFPCRHIIGHFGEDSDSQSLNTGADNLTRTTKRQNTKKIMQNNAKRSKSS